MDNELRIVQGNTFATAIEIHAVDATGQPIVDWSLDDSTDLRVWYVFAGREVDITTWSIENGKVVILWLANQQRVGAYDIFVDGVFNGGQWRNAMQYQFRIVRFNHEANIPSNVIILDGIYQLSAEMAVITRMFDNRGTPSNTTPNMDGEAEVGTEERYARGDHRHPSDTSKQDVISDLSTIRSGAAAGATAYQKPSTGIPKTDLASAVQTSLGKADTALQQSNIVDSLSSSRTDAALSANQGMILNETKQDTLTFDNVPTSGSDNPVKSGGVYDAIEDVDAKLDDYAKIDGAYEGMLAGNAMNLVDTTGTPVLREFVFSKSGGSEQIATGTALIKRLRGNTIVWNQLQKNVLFENNAQGYMRAAPSETFTIDNGIATITADSNGTAGLYYGEGYQQIANHKYYLSVWAKAEENVDIFYGSGANTFHLTSAWQHCYWLRTANNNNVVYNNCYVYQKSEFAGKKLYLKYYQLIDLTQMFGAGNEPTSVAEFESLFPLDYYEYNAGELLSFNGNSIKTVGFNQWDEEWELGRINTTTGEDMESGSSIRSANYVKVLPNTNYYSKNNLGKDAWALFYDADKNLITGISPSGTNYRTLNNVSFTTPPNAHYLRFYVITTTSYVSGICINLSDTSKNGTYEPYVANTKDISFYKSIRDANDNILFPYGLLSAGSVYDEVTENKAIKRVGVVDLGTMTWSYNNEAGHERFASISISSMVKVPSGNNVIGNVISSHFAATTGDNTYLHKEDNTMSVGLSGLIYIYSSAFTDAATFKASLNGVMLYYELATPIEVDIEEQNLSYQVDGGGTEQLLPENTSTPTTTPARLDVNYGLDAMATLKNLQKNYLAQTDLDRLLTAMGTALGFTYTKTWDATNNQWNFTITPTNNG